MNRNPSIAVVGGSLTGPALALLLRHAGFERVTVYEALDESVPLAGGVIGLDHVSLGVLEALGVPQHEYVPFTSERIVRIAIADRAERNRTQVMFPGRNTTWTLLHAALVKRLPDGAVHHGRRVSRLDNDESGRTRLGFADGGEESADMVAFADGRNSYGRRVLDPERTLRYSGIIAHRGQFPCGMRDVRDFVRYEPADGRQLNMFPVALEDGRIGVDWTFYTRADEREFYAMFGGHPTVRTFVHPHHISDLARRLVDEEASRVLPTNIASIVHRTHARTALPLLDIDAPTHLVQHVGDSPAVLIGDAVAPVYPHTGRGANNGIEQAQGLALALAQNRLYDADLTAALEAWEKRQLPDVLAALEAGQRRVRQAGLVA